MTPADIRALKALIIFCRAQKIQSFSWRDFKAEFTLEAMSDPPRPVQHPAADPYPSDEERPRFQMRS